MRFRGIVVVVIRCRCRCARYLGARVLAYRSMPLRSCAMQYVCLLEYGARILCHESASRPKAICYRDIFVHIQHTHTHSYASHSHTYTHMLRAWLVRERVSALGFCSILTDIGTSVVRGVVAMGRAKWMVFFSPLVCRLPFTSLHSFERYTHMRTRTERAFNYVASASDVDQGRTTARNTHRSHDD